MSEAAIHHFRITGIEGPSDRGLLNQFHDYLFNVELDPGGVQRNEHVKVLVTLFDRAFFSVAYGNPRESPYLEEGQARLAQYVITTLLTLLPGSPPAFPLRLNPSLEEVQELQNVDVGKVDVLAWYDVPSEAPPANRRVFISCGQQSDDELNLGTTIAELAKSRTGIDGYFAEYQHSLDGVTKDIFNAIHSASGFIAVMHRRDQISEEPAEYRASVWIEQEVAIASFLVQSLGLRLPARVYVQKGIRREGVRGFILVNPIEFETAEDVLADLEDFWPTVI